MKSLMAFCLAFGLSLAASAQSSSTAAEMKTTLQGADLFHPENRFLNCAVAKSLQASREIGRFVMVTYTSSLGTAEPASRIEVHFNVAQNTELGIDAFLATQKELTLTLQSPTGWTEIQSQDGENGYAASTVNSRALMKDPQRKSQVSVDISGCL